MQILIAMSLILTLVAKCQKQAFGRLGRVSMMDIESSNFSWSYLTSLHHTKHTTTSIDTSEDDINRSFEVCICSIHVLCKLLLFLSLEKH